MNAKDVIEQLTPQARDFLLPIITAAQEAIKQRDELLETLEEAISHIESYEEQIDAERWSGRSIEELEALGLLPGIINESRELIARVKGGAA